VCDGFCHVLGDPLATDPGVLTVGPRAGGGLERTSGQAAPGRFTELAGYRLRPGAASSSCSYAAVALARPIFRKGADFTAAKVFELASTNLVIELGIVMIVLLGWQFALAEFLGAPVIVVILVPLFRTFLTCKLVKQAREQADKGVQGRMEGHAEMDMPVTGGSLFGHIFSSKRQTAISHY